MLADDGQGGRRESIYAVHGAGKAEKMIDWLQLVMAATDGGSAPESPWRQMIMLFVIVGLMFYLIILRPQKREQQAKQKMLETVEKGDRVVTIGGIHGVVAGVDQNRNTVSVDAGKNVKLEFSRQAISSIEKKSRKSASETAKEK